LIGRYVKKIVLLFFGFLPMRPKNRKPVPRAIAPWPHRRKILTYGMSS
jgi:hypothetical protein